MIAIRKHFDLRRCGHILLLAGLLGSPLTTGVRADDTIETKLFFKAEAALRQGQSEPAKQDCMRVLKLNAKHAGAHFLLGQIALREGRRADARRYLAIAARDADYEVRAREMLVDLNHDDHLSGELAAIRDYLEAGAHDVAWDRAAKALARDPQHPGLLALGAQAAAMASRFDDGDRLLAQLQSVTTEPDLTAQLRLLNEAMRCADHAPNDALTRLAAITDNRVNLPPVRKLVRKLMIEQRQYDAYEAVLQAEMARPGADQSQCRIELGRLHLITGQYQKGIEVLAAGNIQSLAENVLYIELLSASGQEERAVRTARILMPSYGSDDELKQALLDALCHWTERLDHFPTEEELKDANLKTWTNDEIKRIGKTPAAAPTPMLLQAAYLGLYMGTGATSRALIEQATTRQIDDTTSPMLVRLANQLNLANLRDIGIPLLESAVNQRHHDIELRLALARMYYLDERLDDVMKTAHDIFAAHPNQVDALMLMVDVLERRDKLKDGKDLLLANLESPQIPELGRRRLKQRLLRLEAAISMADTDTGTGTGTGTTTPTDPGSGSGSSSGSGGS